MKGRTKFFLFGLFLLSLIVWTTQANSYSIAIVNSPSLLKMTTGNNALITTPRTNGPDGKVILIEGHANANADVQRGLTTLSMTNHTNHPIQLTDIQVSLMTQQSISSVSPDFHRLAVALPQSNSNGVLIASGAEKNVSVSVSFPRASNTDENQNESHESDVKTASQSQTTARVEDSVTLPVHLTFTFKWNGGMSRIESDYTILFPAEVCT